MSTQDAAGFAWLVTELPKAIGAMGERLERMEAAQRAFQTEVRERLDRIEAKLPPAVLTRKQAAKLLKISVRAVDYALSTGALREVRVDGSRSRLVDATSIKSINVVKELEALKLQVAGA